MHSRQFSCLVALSITCVIVIAMLTLQFFFPVTSISAQSSADSTLVYLPLVTKNFIGARIVFWKDQGGNSDIYVMHSNGSGLVRLTNDSAIDWIPSWSPNRQQIAFVSRRDGNDEIYVMNSDGSGQTRLTNNPATDTFPSWSPDGSKIIFSSYRDGSYAEIYNMNPDA